MDSACSDKSAIASRVLRLHTPSMRPCTRLQNANFSSTILESFAGSLTFLAFPKVSTILESYIALESKDLSLRALAQDKARQSISAQADSKKAQNRETLESYIDSQNHKTRCRRSFFSKSTSSDSTLESTFDKSTISLSSQADPLLSSRDLRQQVVAIHKSAKADSSNAADFTTAKKVDSSLEAMDCHAIATALARNDKKNAASKKVDSKSEAQNLKTPAKDSGIFDETAQSVFDSHTTGGRIFLKKHRRNLSGVPCFDTNAELQKVDSSKQAQNVSKQPKDSGSEAQNLKTPAKDSRICDEKPLLCKPRKEIRLAVYRRSAAQQSKVYRAKPNPQTQKPTPKPQRLPL